MNDEVQLNFYLNFGKNKGEQIFPNALLIDYNGHVGVVTHRNDLILNSHYENEWVIGAGGRPEQKEYLSRYSYNHQDWLGFINARYLTLDNKTNLYDDLSFYLMAVPTVALDLLYTLDTHNPTKEQYIERLLPIDTMKGEEIIDKTILLMKQYQEEH